jgi:hypothetical protein
MTSFVAPTGYVDLDNDCNYSIDLKSTRSRESIDPKTDLAFYFDTYIVPKYGLNNINVNNVASFMKDLEMNWTKIDPELKPKILDIMVDGILAKNSSFKVDLLNKLGINENPVAAVGNVPTQEQQQAVPESVSSFGKKSNFGSTDGGMKLVQIAIGLILLALIIILISKMYTFNSGGVSRFI